MTNKIIVIARIAKDAITYHLIRHGFNGLSSAGYRHSLGPMHQYIITKWINTRFDLSYAKTSIDKNISS